MILVTATMFGAKACFSAKKQLIIPSISKFIMYGVFFDLCLCIYCFVFCYFFYINIQTLVLKYFVKDSYTSFFEIIVLLLTALIISGSAFFTLYNRNSLKEFLLVLTFATLFLIFVIKGFTFMVLSVSLFGLSIIIYSAIGIDK